MSIRIAPTSHPQSTTASLLAELQNHRSDGTKAPAKGELAVREKFQDFVGGTFYKEMLKALRAAQKPSKYLNGGQAEKIFQSQMDQQIAEDLAHQYAGHLADPLFENYARQSLSGRSRSSPPAEGAHAFNAVA
jgi:Rod binding domain-containing protein